MMKPEPDPEVVTEATNSRRSVVNIYVIKSIGGKLFCCGGGTGFVIKTKGPDFLVMTNRHVLEGERKPFDNDRDQIFVRVTRNGEDGGVEELLGQLRFQHRFLDLAVIEVKGLSEEMPPALRFAPSSNEPIGTTAVALGYCNADWMAPDGPALARIPAVCPGFVVGPLEDSSDEDSNSDSDEDDEGKEIWLKLDCSLMAGCSGGPVLCKKGVFGVVARACVQITMAVSTESVLEALKEWLHIPATDNMTAQNIIDEVLLL